MWFEDNQSLFYIIFLVLWITGLSSDIIMPVIIWVANGFDYLVSLIFNLF